MLLILGSFFTANWLSSNLSHRLAAGYPGVPHPQGSAGGPDGPTHGADPSSPLLPVVCVVDDDDRMCGCCSCGWGAGSDGGYGGGCGADGEGQGGGRGEMAIIVLGGLKMSPRIRHVFGLLPSSIIYLSI